MYQRVCCSPSLRLGLHWCNVLAAATVVANVPAHVQAAVRANLQETPRHVVLSGITPTEADAVVETYAELGIVERRRFVEADWAAVLLAAPDIPLREPERRRPVRVRVPTGMHTPTTGLESPRSPLPSTLAGQLETRLPDGGLALSSARELPTGARVAVLLAPGLFRLDLRHLEDTLKISLRNLSATPIRSLPDTGPPQTILTTEDLIIARPLATNARMELRIGSGSRPREAEIVLSALSGIAPGTSRVAAQAVVRPSS